MSLKAHKLSNMNKINLLKYVSLLGALSSALFVTINGDLIAGAGIVAAALSSASVFAQPDVR